jgi:hypothetical protein
MTTIEIKVNLGADDAYEDGDGDVINTGSTILVGATNATSHRYGCVRFSSVTIPDGATIDVAYLKMYFGTAANSDVYLNSWAEDSDTPAAPTTGNDTYSVSGKTKTTATLEWDQSNVAGSTPGYYNSPSIVSIIQELMASYSYASGRAIVFFWDVYGQAVTNLSSISTYDDSSNRAATLHIEYSTGSNPVTENLNLVSTKLSAYNLTAITDIIINLNCVNMNMQSFNLNILAGDVIVPLNRVNIYSINHNLSVLPGEAIVPLNQTILNLIPFSVNIIIPDSIIVPINTVQLSLSAKNIDIIPGNISVALNTVILNMLAGNLDCFNIIPIVKSFTLYPRTFTFTLNNRNSSLTLNSRVKNFSLEDR